MIGTLASVTGALATVVAVLYAIRQLRLTREQVADRGLEIGVRRTGRVVIDSSTGEQRQQVNIVVRAVGSGIWSDVELRICERDGATVEKVHGPIPALSSSDGELSFDSVQHFTLEEIASLFAMFQWVEPAGTSLRQQSYRASLEDGQHHVERFVWKRFQRARLWYQREHRRGLPWSGRPAALGEWKLADFRAFELEQIPGLPQVGREATIQGLRRDEMLPPGAREQIMSRHSELLGARPDSLPIAASIWDAADRHDLNGPAVVIALYQAIQSMETELIAKEDRQP